MYSREMKLEALMFCVMVWEDALLAAHACRNKLAVLRRPARDAADDRTGLPAAPTASVENSNLPDGVLT